MKFKIIMLTFAMLLTQQMQGMNLKNAVSNLYNSMIKPSLKTTISIGRETAISIGIPAITYGLKHLFAKVAQNSTQCLNEIGWIYSFYQRAFPNRDHMGLYANIAPYCADAYNISSGGENICNGLFYISSIATIGSLIYAFCNKYTIMEKKHLIAIAPNPGDIKR